MDAYDRHAERLDRELSDGLISEEQYREEMRALRDAFLQQEAEKAAEEAYRNVMGYDGPGWY